MTVKDDELVRKGLEDVGQKLGDGLFELSDAVVKMGNTVGAGLEYVANALDDKLGSIADALNDTAQSQIMPAPGWRVVGCRFTRLPTNFCFSETPLIGWRVSGATVEPIYWDNELGKVRVFPNEDSKHVRCEHFELLNPSQELDEKMRNHLSIMAVPCNTPGDIIYNLLEKQGRFAQETVI